MPMSKPQPAHKRNVLATIRRLKTAPPDAGGHIDESVDGNWEVVTKQWVSIISRDSREFPRQEQLAADITHQVEMLYNSESKLITVKMRVFFDGRKLAISEPPRNTDENNHSLVFACVEVLEGQ